MQSMSHGVFSLSAIPAALALGTLFGGGLARADEITLNSSDESWYSTVSWNTGDRWSNEKAPLPGNTYLVDNKTIRTPNTSDPAAVPAFAGDQLILRNGGRLLLKNSGDAVATVADLQGGAGCSIDQGEANQSKKIDGTITINGTAANPFKFTINENAGGSWRTIDVLATLVGDPSSAIDFSVVETGTAASDYKGTLRLAGDNSQFNGTISLWGDMKNGVSAICALANDDTVGPFTVRLGQNAVLEVASGCSGISGLNGIDIQANSAKISLRPITEGAVTLSQTITAATDFTIDIGDADTLVLSDAAWQCAGDVQIVSTCDQITLQARNLTGTARIVCPVGTVATLDATTAAGGVEFVNVVRRDTMVYLDKKQGYGEHYGLTGFWSNKEPAQSGLHYFVTNNLCVRTPANTSASATPYIFPGESLSLLDTSSLMLKCCNFQVRDLFISGNALVSVGTENAQDNIVLDGSITIGGQIPQNTYSIFRSEQSRKLEIAAQLHGDSTKQIKFAYDDWQGGDVTSGTYILSADNSETYFGRMYARVNAWKSLDCDVRLCISDERNLGGNPDHFIANALQLFMAKLCVTNTVVIDDTNRGITLNEAVVDVADGAELVLKSPVKIERDEGMKGRLGTIKTGAGAFSFAGTIDNQSDLKDENGVRTNALCITEGSYLPLNAHSVENLRLVFSDGTGLRISPDRITDADFATYGLLALNSFEVADGGQVTVRIDVPAAAAARSWQQPIVTVRAEQADAVLRALTIDQKNSKQARHQISLVSEPITVATVACRIIKASYKASSLVILVR